MSPPKNDNRNTYPPFNIRFYNREGHKCSCQYEDGKYRECAGEVNQYCPDPCKRGNFWCGGEKCVADNLKCDSNNDCGDWDDEAGCKITDKHKLADIKLNTKLKKTGEV